MTIIHKTAGNQIQLPALSHTHTHTHTHTHARARDMVRFQNLLKTLFLTLQGYNIHRQHRELSKFLMEFVSHAYCEATRPGSKMASQQEKAFCVLRFDVSRSVITVQREFRTRFKNVHETHRTT
jgi:hypothetical protein